MASFLAAVLRQAGASLPAAPPDAFVDDDGMVAEPDIDVLAAVGVATGDGSGNYQPTAPVSRGQMALLLVRVLDVLVGEGLVEPLAQP